MTDDEHAIRKLIDTWLAASKNGDLATVLSLMADDVIFMVPGRAAFGKAELAADSEAMKDMRLETESEIVEVKVLGDWAFTRVLLAVTVTPPGGKPMRRTGYTLTLFNKEPDGDWVMARDANMLAAEAG